MFNNVYGVYQCLLCAMDMVEELRVLAVEVFRGVGLFDTAAHDITFR